VSRAGRWLFSEAEPEEEEGAKPMSGVLKVSCRSQSRCHLASIEGKG
jgi:hypothetical protein